MSRCYIVENCGRRKSRDVDTTDFLLTNYSSLLVYSRSSIHASRSQLANNSNRYDWKEPTEFSISPFVSALRSSLCHCNLFLRALSKQVRVHNQIPRHLNLSVNIDPRSRVCTYVFSDDILFFYVCAKVKNTLPALCVRE